MIMPGRPRNARLVLFSTGAILVGLALIAYFARGSATDEPAYAPRYATMPAGASGVLLFGVHPLHNPQRLSEVYGPLVDYLNSRLPQTTIQLEASRSYEEFDKKLYGRHFHLALPNPFQTVNSLQHGYHVFGKMGNDDDFRGIILVRRDGGIESVADLKGKAVSFPAPTALAATMMPLYYLHTHGLDVNQDIERVFAGSQESSIMNVYLGRSAAGATWPLPWRAFRERSPEVAATLVVKWETPPLINNALVVRDDVPAELVERVAVLLCELHTHDTGRALLAALPLSQFERATNETYAVVSAFLERYQAAIH
jgi:phosphonate transport system substrate-binding protein